MHVSFISPRQKSFKKIDHCKKKLWSRESDFFPVKVRPKMLLNSALSMPSEIKRKIPMIDKQLELVTVRLVVAGVGVGSRDPSRSAQKKKQKAKGKKKR